ncbi:MAG: ATP-binding domain-containing protein, partial [Comamonas sp.]
MAGLLDALPASARLVLLGDKDQLASVEAGAVLGDLCRDAQEGRYSPDTVAYVQRVTGDAIAAQFHAAQGAFALAQHTVMLRESRRFDGPIAALALAVNAGDAVRSRELLEQSYDDDPICMRAGGPVQHVHALAWDGRGDAVGYQVFAQALQQWRAIEATELTRETHERWVREVLRAFDRFRLLCAVREGEWGVAGLNAAVQHRLSQEGVIPKEPGEWYRGRPVMVTRNDAALGVFNGDIGIALPSSAEGHPLRVYFLNGEELRSVSVARLAHVETAFAMTVHKSQGSEFEHTALVLSAKAGGVLGRELVYTGITRARQAFTLVAEDRHLLAQAIASPTRRTSGLLRFLEGQMPLQPDDAEKTLVS